MKVSLMMVLLLVSLLADAQSVHEQKVKAQMVERTQGLIEKVTETRVDLEAKDVVSACSKVHEIFRIYPDHIKDIGVHMDHFESKIIKIYKESISQLALIHLQTLECNRGESSEYVDPKDLSSQLKEIQKDLEKQLKIIKKADTSFQNSYYYDYRF